MQQMLIYIQNELDYQTARHSECHVHFAPYIFSLQLYASHHR